MLYYLHHLSGYWPVLNVTRYITFRTAAASITALAIGLLVGPWMIQKLRDFQIGQVIRQEGPATHRTKAGTPTMGGLLILTSVLVPTLLWADLATPFVWIAVLATAGFGAIGFADDYLKIVRRSHHGLLPRYKMLWQTVVGLMKPLRILIAGGGTGGHLFPGIAVAREVLRRQSDAVVTFAGTARGIESRVIPREGFSLDVLRSAGIKSTSLQARLRGLSLLPLSGLDAWRILSRRSPDVVIGVGGYSSGPVVLAAAARRIPTLLLEQNAVPGLTNRLLARVVSSAAVTFESTVGFFGGKGFVTGNPVRPEFFDVAPERVAGPPRVLIFGGSQGAHAINVAMS